MQDLTPFFIGGGSYGGDAGDLTNLSKGWLILAAMSPATSKIVAKIKSKVEEEDDEEYEFYHGTDLQTGLMLLNGASINVEAGNCNWSASCGGFYLADDIGDAIHFANFTDNGQRDDPAVVKYTFSSFAYKTIAGISSFGPIPMASRYNPAGNQLVVPPQGFTAFNRLMKAKEIKPGPP